ncbi:CDP-glycerol glycerophosphotransferase [Bacilli bacterium PM5-3]|nr:CDP-glycerol glycerophosphotransferase [Bacilli bacterium PM5-3]
MAKKLTNYGKSINIKQTDDKVIIEFDLYDDYNAKSMTIVSKLSKQRYNFDLIKENNKYRVVIDYSIFVDCELVEISDEFLSKIKLFKEQDLVEFYDIFLELEVANELDIYGKNTSIAVLDDLSKSSFYHLGGFDKVTLNDETTINKITKLECGKDGHYGFGFGCHYLPFFEQSVNMVNISNGKIVSKGNIKTNLKVDEMYFSLKGKDTFKEYDLLLEKLTSNQVDVGVSLLSYEINYDLKNIVNDDFIADTYAINYKFISDGIEYIDKQKRYSFIQRQSIKKFCVDGNKKTFYFCPTFTFKAKLLRFQIEDFEKEEYEYLKQKTKTRLIDRLKNKHRDIWLVSERIYKAQDNGFYFFKYMRENHPEKEVYYVIDRESKEVEKLKQYGNVVYYKSKEHIELTFLASKFISTHHYDYMLPLRDEDFKKKLKGAVIFLQHGVMGTKYMANLYGNDLKTFVADSFIVSSEKEKGYIITDFKFAKEDIYVTGLARYDNLFNAKKPKKQVVIIPTWRDWLQNVDKFMDSDYFKRYKSLISNEVLIKKCQMQNIEIVFCLHPNMQQYTPLFESDIVKVVSQGEIDVQTLIKESSLLVTDFSSVAFDFSFLNKPVLYYMFDRERFFGKEGSHLDVDSSLPGRIIAFEDVVVDEITKYIDNGFVMEEKYQNRANQFIEYKDVDNSKRIMDVVIKTKRDKSLKTKIKKSDALKLIGVFYRNSKIFSPTIKIVIKLLKLLPMKQDLVVLESGMGKAGGDNPMALYNVLKKELPNMKKVWVSETPIPDLDENTIRIQRLSLAYFYYLAMAKYWVNNQNYPHYMIRRKYGVNLQTWHGTPIKKMFYDLKKVYGRDKGYKKRVGRAIEQWTYLLSPNSYSTECFKTAFKTKAKILELGYPRNDILYQKNNDDYCNQIKDKIAIRTNKKAILYAPTFRDDTMVKRGKFNQAVMFDYKKMYESLGDDQVLLMRTHMVVVNELSIPPEYSDRIIDVSNYPNVEDLLLISDALITDYSSVFFDYLNLERPIIFYAYDLDKYQNTLRGFYLDYSSKTLPGPIVQEKNDLYSSIENISKIENEYINKIKSFKNEYCANDDGYSSERVVNKVFKK